MRAPVVQVLQRSAFHYVVRVERADATAIARGEGATVLDAIDDARIRLAREIAERRTALALLDREATPLIWERGSEARSAHAG